MNKFTIKDIENLSGIKAHTWRIWEQRYGIGMPQRKDSNHRYYDNDNLKQVLRISYLYHNGLKISKIASLNPSQIKEKALARLSSETHYEYYIKELIEASIDLDEIRFERVLEQAIQQQSIEAVIINVIHPFQEKIGVLWLTDHVIPAQEHFTSNIISRKLAVAIEELPAVKEHFKKEVILFAPSNEHHEIPLQLIHYLLKKNGNKVVYFGKNTALSEIQSYTSVFNVDYLMFHLLTLLKSPAEAFVKEVSSTFPAHKIFMSGPLVEFVNDVPGNVRLLKSIQQMREFCAE